MRKQHELVMDELLPKATGKEARFEKKKVRAEKRRDREISPGWWGRCGLFIGCHGIT